MMQHGHRGKTAILFHPSATLLMLFRPRHGFTTATKPPPSPSAEKESELGDLLIVASIAKALSKPRGTHYLEKHADSVPLSEDLVLQVLRRNSLDVSKKLEFFRWCSLRPNYKHSAETYSQMLKAICRFPNRHHEDILYLLASMTCNGLVINSSVLKLILDTFLKSGKFDSALEILDYFEKGFTTISSLDLHIYSSVMIALVRKNRIDVALPIFHKLLESSSSPNGEGVGIPDVIACNELLVGLKKAGMREQFKQIFLQLRNRKLYPLDRWGYNICIHAFGFWGDLATSFSLFKEMKEKGGSLSPDLCTYNSLIHVLCSRGKVKDALIVWEELKASSGHEPDAFTYRILMQGCTKSYRIDDAIKIFNEMQYNGIRPATVVYNSLLNGLLKARKLTEACRLFEKMVDDDGVRASCWTYNILIDGLFRNGRPEAAYTLFSDLKRKGNTFVDSITYGIVILHLCRENQLEDALQLAEEMEARGLVVDLVAVTTLLINLYRNGQWDRIERMMRYIRDGNLVPAVLKWKATMEASMKDVQGKAKDFTPMFPSKGDFADLVGYVKSATEFDDGPSMEEVKQQNDESDEWSSSPYMDMLANHFDSKNDDYSWPFSLSKGVRVEAKGEDSFDIDMVNTYLSIFLAKGKLSLACKLFEIFSNMGVNPVSYTYNSIMSSFVKKGYFKEACGVLHAMGETVCLADIATYNVIVQGLGKMGRADLANVVLDKLMEQGGYLDIVMYNTLINALGKAGRIDEANKLFQQMKNTGINPDVVTYNTLIEVHTKAGRLRDAYKFLKMMLDAGCSPDHVTDTILDFLGKEIEKLRYQRASIRGAHIDDPS